MSFHGRDYSLKNSYYKVSSKVPTSLVFECLWSTLYSFLQYLEVPVFYSSAEWTYTLNLWIFDSVLGDSVTEGREWPNPLFLMESSRIELGNYKKRVGRRGSIVVQGYHQTPTVVVIYRLNRWPTQDSSSDLTHHYRSHASKRTPPNYTPPTTVSTSEHEILYPLEIVKDSFYPILNDFLGYIADRL